MFKKLLACLLLLQSSSLTTSACSIFYYVDPLTHKIYAVSNEDYWYNVKPYIKIIRRSGSELARLWLGWNNIGQSGINEAGLFLDAATTPQESPVAGFKKPRGNMTDDILSSCRTVDDVLAYFDKNKIALTDAHLLIGDNSGNAIVVEWVNRKQNIIRISNNKLMVTNFLLTDTEKGNYPCQRYSAMEGASHNLLQSDTGIQKIGRVLAKAVQPPSQNSEGKIGGTLFSTFADITEMKLIVVYKLDNSKKITLDLKKEFAGIGEKIIKMESFGSLN